MGRTPAGKDLVFVAEFDEEANLVDVVVRFDLFGQTRRKIERGRSPIEHQVDAFLERRFCHRGSLSHSGFVFASP